MTSAEVITEARRILNDRLVRGSAGRFTPEDYTGWTLTAIQFHALYRPDLFATRFRVDGTGDILYAAPEDSIRLIDVLQFTDPVNGVTSLVNEVNYAQLVDAGAAATTAGSRRKPAGLLYAGSGWDRPPLTGEGRPREWARRPNSPNGFVVNPPAGSGGSMLIEYARSPVEADIAKLPDAYRSTMISCVVWQAESSEDQAMNTGRAQQAYDAWTSGLGAGREVRALLDDPGAGVDDVRSGPQAQAQAEVLR